MSSSIWRCNVCGNLLSKFYDGKGELVCCEQPMENVQIKNLEEGVEKHKPVFEKTDDAIIITVGEVPHPMEEDHWIELIQIVKDDKVIMEKRLFPGEEPKMKILPHYDIENVKILSYCNKHGLWEND